ncbi:Na+/H+ antiporter subunit A [Dietzia natronolimnaea]|uniref:Na+/H+ antiporter subunit A n=1 Tax=Dietzia natronolimnaea TaxID=161920 RepID=A0A2A2WT28_9ACTN|nr:Na+/H+ antiporter subunit A [Dietzia natronolimnaea]PAY24193.1 Na+/H+ antiporter subunit A [Dietzia natronolimnaea]
MIAILSAHAVATLIAIPLVLRFGRRAFLALALVPAASAVWVAANLDRVPTESVRWAPEIHLALDLRMDALSALLALIALGVGALVLVYCTWYFQDDEPRLHLFAAELVAFAGVMFGLVVADNMILLYIFWEITSVLSFLLVGHYAARATARRAATQALLVTTLGGLAMLVGMIILGQAAGSYLISDVVASPPSGPLIHWALVLVIVGAGSKSAIAPLHFWLPGAMSAPTPVSAYLHSAAMVKAGVFLVAALTPGLSGSSTWQLPLIVLGLVSLLMAGWRALRETDLKLVLAFGTVSQLGFLLVLVGIGSRDTMLAGLTMLLAHSLFKSALFMSVGVIDKTTGTREIRDLSGLGHRRPALALVFTLAAASMAGLPPFLGFVGKEAAFATVLSEERLHGMPSLVVTAGLVAGSVLTFSYTARLVMGAFRSKRSFPDGISPAVAGSRPAGPLFLSAPAVLAVSGLVLGLWNAPVENLIARYVDVAFPPGSPWRGPEGYHLGLWHGIGIPLALTLVVYVLGTLLYVAQRTVERMQFDSPALGNADRIYDAVLRFFDTLSLRLTASIQRGSLPLTLGIILVTLVLFPFISLLAGTREGLRMELSANPVVLIVMIPMALAAVAAAVLRNRLAAVICMSVTGYGLAVIFAFHGAPDLALTQALVETLLMVAFVLVLRTMPAEVPLSHGYRRLRAWLGIGVGLLVVVTGAYAINARQHPAVSLDFPDIAYRIGNGANAVNVTLVDIRAWDTLGEITVLLVAATGVASLVFRNRRYGSGPRLADVDKTRSGRRGVEAARIVIEAPGATPGRWLVGATVRDPRARSLVLEVTTRLVFPTMMVLSLFFFFAGHNNPGGGFAGGLVAGLALVLRYLAGGRYELGEAIPIDAGRILGLGLLLAAGTATASMFFGAPALSSATFEATLPVFGEVKFVTALLFDAGVYLIVVGLVLDILRSLGARLDLDAEDLEELRAIYVDATESPSTAALRSVPGVDADGARSDLAAHRAARREAAENQGAPSGGRS